MKVDFFGDDLGLKMYTFTECEYKDVANYIIENYEIACGDGWYVLLNELLFLIKNHQSNQKTPLPFQISQVKEKFGGLRFYFDDGDDYINGLVRFAESISYMTCETCGSNQQIGM